MIKYEDYVSACWILGTSRSSQDFIRSEFYYGIRQRRALRGYNIASFGIYVKYDQMLMFKKFWHDLEYGTKKFKTDMPIFADKSKDKIVRFTTAFNITDIDGVWYKIDSQVEILKTTLDSNLNLPPCPRIPKPGLAPYAPLFPCGTP